MGMVACFCAVEGETLSKLTADPSLIEDYLYPNDGDDDPPNYVDVDKAWHGIHFLLTGTADAGEVPLSLAVLGGKEIGNDVGYGPARVLSPDQVRQVADALAKLTDEQLRQRYAPKAMEKAGIYPDIWVRDGQEALDYLMDNYQQLLVFYRDAAARGDGAILWLS